MSSAVERVLETPELLEIIIASLPVGRILVVQAVGKTWQNAIVKSPTIQKLIFRRATAQPISPTSVRQSRIPSGMIIQYDHDLEFSSTGAWQVYRSKKRPDEVRCVSLSISLLNVSTSIDYSFLGMYLTNPPITTATMVVLSYEDSAKDARRDEIRCSVRSPQGLTEGYLVEVADDIVRTTGRAEYISKLMVAVFSTLR